MTMPSELHIRHHKSACLRRLSMHAYCNVLLAGYHTKVASLAVSTMPHCGREMSVVMAPDAGVCNLRCVLSLQNRKTPYLAVNTMPHCGRAMSVVMAPDAGACSL